MLNELRFQFAREDRPRPYGGPNVSGQTRPFPDTAFDFGSGYRFGEPFFIPVEYNDTRFQIVDSVSWIKGRHTLKAGFELNRVNSSQTFIGFANGRYVFGSTQGFLNYAQLGPTLCGMLRRLHERDRQLPGRDRHHRAAPVVSAAGGRWRLDGRRGGHARHPAGGTRPVHPGQVAAQRAPHRARTASAGRPRSSPT